MKCVIRELNKGTKVVSTFESLIQYKGRYSKNLISVSRSTVEQNCYIYNVCYSITP